MKKAIQSNPIFVVATKAALEKMCTRKEQRITYLGWYFWDESWAYAHGPFSTREEAARALKVYADEL